MQPVICILVGVILKVTFYYLPKNIITTDFFAGWITCIVWYSLQKK
jgi:hypothetical protein